MPHLYWTSDYMLPKLYSKKLYMTFIRKSSLRPSYWYNLCTIWTWFDWDMSETLGICYQSSVQKSSNVIDNKEPITTYRTVYFIHCLDQNWLRYEPNNGESTISKKAELMYTWCSHFKACSTYTYERALIYLPETEEIIGNGPDMTEL